jgi:SH3-like domain-containing protein
MLGKSKFIIRSCRRRFKTINIKKENSMKRLAYSFSILCAISLLVIACAPVATTPSATAQPSPVSTDTPSPTPSLTPTNTPPVLIIKIEFAYLRAGPNVDFPSISDAYPKGTKMEILSVYQDWFYVKALTDGKIGWLYTGWISLEPSVNLSIIATPSFIPRLPRTTPTNVPAYPNP